MSDITPFIIAVPDAKIADLQRRLAATILPGEIENSGWSQGPTEAFVSTMVDASQDASTGAPSKRGSTGTRSSRP